MRIAIANLVVNTMLVMATPRPSRVHDPRMAIRGRLNDFPATFITDEANSTPFESCDEEVSGPESKTEIEAQPQLATSPAGKTPSDSSSNSSLDPGNDFIQNALYHHNIHRSNHSAPVVSWCIDLADAAHQLASSCKYGHNTNLGVGGYGQNIAMYAATDNLGTELDFIRTSITEYWYNGEISLYGNAYGGEPNMTTFHDWGHFSQIVWKDTVEVGCAVAYCGPETGLARYPGFYSVCNYSPAGNRRGQFAANVLPPLGQKAITH